MEQNLISFFENKSVILLGFGREGKSTYDFLKKYVASARITVADKNEVEVIGADYRPLDAECLADLDSYDIIMKSPGIALKDDITASAKKKVTSQTDLFLRSYSDRTIGITGTKGKSTTTSLIWHILDKCGKKPVLAGNIGKPVFSELDKITPETTIVYELSCHQLEYVCCSPHIAVLINIYPDHLDHYISFDAYRRAKYNIFTMQKPTDTLIVGSDCENIDYGLIDALPQQKLFIGKDTYADSNNMYANGEAIPISCVKTQLIGKNNMNNIAVAVTVAGLVGITTADALKAVESFKGLEHRLEYVCTVNGVRYFNDSIATVPESAISAIESIGDVTTIIVGGMDRGISYDKFADYLAKGAVKNVIISYASGKRVKKLLEERECACKIYEASDLHDAVKTAMKITVCGSCLFSPAAASYDSFTNFEQRGQFYKSYIKELQND